MSLNLAFFYMSIPDAVKIHQALAPSYTTDDNGNFQFPCETDTTLQFEFGGVSFSVSTMDYVGPVVRTDPNGSTWCASMIIGFPGAAVQAWTVGTGFLRNVRITHILKRC
jgi:hypothetical protein